MRAIFVLFDTLNRHFLEPYGSDLMKTPNFQRLAEKSVRFDSHYVGSLPCMPARRDLQTGRLNFMHRSWGPLEPFDTAMTDILKKQDIYSHLVTDHYHYLEVGGAGYQDAFTSFEFLRGQEGDGWKGHVNPDLSRYRRQYHADQYGETPGELPLHNMINRDYVKEEADFSSVQCFDLGCEFLEVNKDADNWFLQIETFDPHEPFHAPERWRQQFPSEYDGPTRDWPPYAQVTQAKDEADELRANYMALLAHCDAQMGRLLDQMDALGMWDDTMLVVSTDHGYLTGEHDWWAKNRMPAYQEIAHIPLFVHHPDHVDAGGQSRNALSQTIDLMPTFLDAFGCDIPNAVRGKSLLPVLSDSDAINHDCVIFGYFGGAINVTDGRYSYFRYPENLLSQELYQYTLIPSHMREHFVQDEMRQAVLVTGIDYAEGFPVMRIPVIEQSPWYSSHGPAAMVGSDTLLFDVTADPQQETPLADPTLHAAMAEKLTQEMQRNNAPPEAFERLDLTPAAERV
ncbi:MAG: sulfatase [Pseudoruegeria sp.]